MIKEVCLFSLLCCLTLVGCTQNISPNVYTVDEVGTTSHVLKATIVSMRAVEINNQSNVGGVAGSAVGATAGSAIGGDVRANLIGAIGGAVVGGVIGEAIDKNINQQRGIEYILKLAKGDLVSVTQVDALNLHVGQHVLVIYGARTRIVPDTTFSQYKRTT